MSFKKLEDYTEAEFLLFLKKICDAGFLTEKEQVDALIDSYFEEGYTEEIRMKIYCYIAISGLLWSNWCEYKRFCGVEFGEYSLRQYHYAKEYYNILKKMNRFKELI